MEDQQSYNVRTETGEIWQMTQDEVAKLVRSSMERAKSATSKKTLSLNTTADAATTAADPSDVASTAALRRLSLSPRSPNSMRRYFHKNSEDSQTAMKSTTSQLFRNFRAAVSTGGSSRRSFRYGRKGKRLPIDTDGPEIKKEEAILKNVGPDETRDEDENNILLDSLNDSERKSRTQPSFIVSTEAEGKKQMSETEINDLVRKTIRRVRQNAKLKSQKSGATQDSSAPSSDRSMAASPLCDDVAFSPDKTVQRKFSWSSVEKSDDEGLDENDGVEGITATMAVIVDSRDDTSKRDATEMRDTSKRDAAKMHDSRSEMDTVDLLPGTTLQTDQPFETDLSPASSEVAIKSTQATTTEALDQTKTDGAEVQVDLIKPPQTMMEEVATTEPTTHFLASPSSSDMPDNACTSPLTPGEPSLSSLLSNGGESMLSGKDICMFVQNSIDRVKLTRLEITELLGATPQNDSQQTSPIDAPCRDDESAPAADGTDTFNGCASPLSGGQMYRGFFFTESEADSCNDHVPPQAVIPTPFAPMIEPPVSSPSTIPSDRDRKLTSMKKMIEDCRHDALSQEGFVLDPLNLIVHKEMVASGNTLFLGVECCSPFECSSRLTASPVGKQMHFFGPGESCNDQGDSPKSIKFRIDLAKRDGDDASGIEITVVSTSSSLESENSLVVVGSESNSEKERMASKKSQISNDKGPGDVNNQSELPLRYDKGNVTEECPGKFPESSDGDVVERDVLLVPAVFTRVTTMTEIVDQTIACAATEVELIEEAEARNQSTKRLSDKCDDAPTTSRVSLPPNEDGIQSPIGTNSDTRNASKRAPVVENVALEVCSDEVKELVKYAVPRPEPLLKDRSRSGVNNTNDSIPPFVENAMETRQRMSKYTQRLKKRSYNKRASHQARSEKSKSIQLMGSDSAMITEEFLEEISSKKGSKISANELAQLLASSTSKRSESQHDSIFSSSTADDSLGYERRGRSLSRSRRRSRSRSRSRSRTERGASVAPALQSQFCMDFLDLFKPVDIRNEDDYSDAYVCTENSNAVTWIDSGADDNSANSADVSDDDISEKDVDHTRSKTSKCPSEVTDTMDELKQRRITFSFSDGRVTDRYDDPTSSDESSTSQQ